MKLQCHECEHIMDTVRKDAVFTNVKTKLNHEAVHYYCSTSCQNDGRKKAELRRPQLVRVNGAHTL